MSRLLDLVDGIDRTKAVSVVGGLVVCYFAGRFTLGLYQTLKVKQKNKDKREEGQLACQKLEEHLRQNMPPLEKQNEILGLSFSELQQKLQTGELKSLEVVQTYQLKALEENKRLNCITEPILEAEEWATARDLQSGKKGPLHGIPISLKESYYIKGYDCTTGMSDYIDKPRDDECVLVQVLKKQGAVPFVRTNIPQTMMTYECSNPIYGRTNNPHDVTRGPGGSSGGEGSIIGAKASVMGFGSDIGGSIRIPANMCGVCGIKPTCGRLSGEGTFELGKGQKLVPSTTGPMAQDVDGVVMAMKALLVPQMFELDPCLPPLMFNNEMYESKKPLRIGYFKDNGYINSVPAMHRAVDMAKTVLESKGHTLVPFTPPDPVEMFKLYILSTFCDGGKTFAEALKNDILDEDVSLTIRSFKWPRLLRYVISLLTGVIARDNLPKILVQSLWGHDSVYDYLRHAENIDAFKLEMFKSWKGLKLDAVICPGFAFPAVPQKSVFHVLGGVTYTVYFNLINYPAGSLPVTKVTEEDERKMANYPKRTMYEKGIHKAMKGSTGLPCNVQCVALPFQEELVLRLMKEIEDGLKK